MTTAAQSARLSGNGLPARWQGRDAFTVLATGFGLGHAFLATWEAWRRDPHRSGRLSFVCVERHPPCREALRAAHRGARWAGLAASLADAWPPATPDLHRIAFDEGRIELLLAFGDPADWLPELEIAVDAFLLDDLPPPDVAPARDAMTGKALGRLAAAGATLVASACPPALRDGLARAGFVVQTAAEEALTVARFEPVHRAPLSGRRAPRAASPEHRAMIVGGGLAGTAAAWALAERGWRSTLFERQPRLAAEASGNPGGLFHGTLHAADSVHARFGRAAALAVRPEVERAIAAHGVEGASNGFLRLETRLAPDAMQALLARSGLPSAYVEAVSAERASALAGVPLASPAWHYPGGGWVDPAGLAHAYAARAGGRLERRMGVDVASIRSTAGRWRLFDAEGHPIDEAETLVLANAADAVRLLGDTGWPLARLRGQLSAVAAERLPPWLQGCRLPVAGAGYLIPVRGGLLFGATRQRSDDDGAVRTADHLQNIARLEAMLGVPLGLAPGSLSGRTAWRASAADRLPLIGAVPSLDILRGRLPPDRRWARARQVPREPGLFVFTALGSRGITASALGAQVLAAAVAGSAAPLGAGLLDAIDPARFVSRGVRVASLSSSSGQALAPRAGAETNQGAGCP